MSLCRGDGFNGPLALTPHDFEAWSRVTGNILRREEILVLRRMDIAFLKAVSEKEPEPEKDSRVSERPAREVFDAIWS